MPYLLSSLRCIFLMPTLLVCWLRLQAPQLKALLCHIWLLGDLLFIITSSFVTYLCQDVPPGVEEPEVDPGEEQVPQGSRHHSDRGRPHQHLD